MKVSKRKLKSTFYSSSGDMFLMLLSYVIPDFILRVYEFYLLKPYYHDLDTLLKNQLDGYYHEVFKFSTMLFFFLPLYYIINYFAGKKSLILAKALLFAFIILSFMTVQYFVVSFTPLDQSFYSYSFGEIVDIIMSSGDVSWISYFVFIIICLLFYISVKFIRINHKVATIIIWLIWIIGLPNISYSHVKQKFFDNPQDYFLVKNKAIYFIEQSARYFKNNSDVHKEYSDKYIHKMAKDYAALYKDNKYILPPYPLLRKRNDKDVLGRYFDFSDSMPNIVFIIMESMGRNVCGQGARFGSFTPFLDSLINHSLYWENFLSNADRTFGAIPNILGSLPFGDKSFHDHKQKPLPFHKSIISDLNDNGYHSSFYYGGWTHFNNMDDILNASNIDFILNKFDKDATKIKSDAENFSWGYDDKSLFRQYLKTINSDSIRMLKRLDIILTLSLHLPFMPPDEDYYLSKFREIAGSLPESKKLLIKPFTKQLTSVLYADDALRYLFGEYKKRDDFANTIFILTGDHNLHAMPDDNELRQYNVPLIIFSPMLRKGKKFKSIGSHQDIYPGIIAMLNQRFKLDLPKVTHTISNGIFASDSFKQNKIIPFFLGRNLNTSILDKGYYFSQNRCYKLSENMNLKPINDDSIFNVLKGKLQIIKDVNKYVYNKNRIIPTKYK